MSRPAGVILAGGQGRRMGGADKALLPLGETTLLAHVVARLGPQVRAMAISANGDPARFAAYGLPVLPDDVPGFAGPLAGVLAALDWAAEQGAEAVVTAAADTPFLPRDMATRLAEAAARGTGVAVAASVLPEGRRLHPTCALWPVALREELRAALAAGERKLGRWAEAQGAAEALFPVHPRDPFFNVNTPEDLAVARALLEAGG